MNYSKGDLENITEASEILKFYTNVVDYSSQASDRTFSSFEGDLTSKKIVLMTTGFQISTSIEEDSGNEESSQSG